VAGDVSFDVVSDFDQQELVNALDQARREIQTRYDFKGSKA
jgi:cyclic-di-GMP-binding protein